MEITPFSKQKQTSEFSQEIHNFIELQMNIKCCLQNQQHLITEICKFGGVDVLLVVGGLIMVKNAFSWD